jgi:multisubunit Na+/H+ antiporter MnhB subunit
MLRLDYILSNWIFLWYVLYVFGIVHYNPKLALIVGILFNTATILLMVYFNASIQNMLYLAFFVSWMKVIPLWTIRNTKIREKDVYASIFLLLVYLGWLLLEGKMMEVYHALEGLLHNKLESPGISMLQKIFG